MRFEEIMKWVYALSVAFILTYLIGCTPSQQTEQTSTGKDSIYVFDSIPDSDAENIPTLEYPDMGMTYYVVQIGAFTTKDRAEKFAKESKQILPFNLKTSFSKQNNLYVVQLSEYYTSRSEAESVRNNLWGNDKFRDAWILTIYK
jgi:cell division protein FtsN